MLGRVVPHDLRPNVTDRNSIQKKNTTMDWCTTVIGNTCLDHPAVAFNGVEGQSHRNQTKHTEVSDIYITRKYGSFQPIATLAL